MAYKINGGTLYPTTFPEYSLTPEEMQLIDAAISGRGIGGTPEQSIAAGFASKDLYTQALNDKALNDQLYLQRLEDERRKRLAEEDMALQEQQAQADFERTSKVIKAKELAGVVEQQAGNPNSFGNPDLAGLSQALDDILGTSQPKTSGTIYKSKGGKYFNVPGMGQEDKTEGKKSLAERIKERNQAKGKTKPSVPSPAELKQIEMPSAIKPESLGGQAIQALGNENTYGRIKKGLGSVAEVHPLVKAASLAFSKDPNDITLDDIAKLIKSFSPIGSAMELQKVWNQAVAPEMFKK